MATRKGKGATPKRRRGVKLKPTELLPTEVAVTTPPADVVRLAGEVRADGGAVLATYREPLGGNVILLVALPVEKVEPTPFQRDLSDAHVRRLVFAMDKTRRYLDPIIVVRDAGAYLTPNGGHRLEAVRELGARSILALLVPEPRVAYQILALNIEKAHNLREKALEVVRMYHELTRLPEADEEAYALEFEEPLLVTLGFAYEKRPRLSGGAYAPILRKVDSWLSGPLASAAEERERRADLVLTLDDAVSEAVKKLKAKGLTSPYLKTFVVARVNPLRFVKGEPPPMDRLLAQMTKRALALDPAKIRTTDVVRSGGAPAEVED